MKDLFDGKSKILIVVAVITANYKRLNVVRGFPY